ncbi:hypothetical protein BDQ17DRAFT_1369809 [Cyathus striatus]|nr:hypothetical protein BDQ17DRAFT_1369809 [Cyathus striatus]
MSQQPLSHSAHNVYNRLPSLAEADGLFPSEAQREFLLKLNTMSIFREHYHYAVTLVHRHATLEPGEIMVSRGDVTRPERIEDAGKVYASAWLTSGEAYEFTSDDAKYKRDGDPRHKLPLPPTYDLRKALAENVAEFGIPSFSGVGILGFRYISEIPDPDEIFLEKTYGRASFLTIIPAPGNFLNLRYAIPSCWLVAFLVSVKQEVQIACACVKDTAHLSVCSDLATTDVKSEMHPMNKTTTTTTTKAEKTSEPKQGSTGTTTTTKPRLRQRSTPLRDATLDDNATAMSISTITTTKDVVTTKRITPRETNDTDTTGSDTSERRRKLLRSDVEGGDDDHK